MSKPYVRPDTQIFLAFLNAQPGPKLHEMTPAEGRAMMLGLRHAADADVGELAVIRNLTCPGPGGDIPLRMYDAREQREPGPVLVFFHGGGWVIGDLDTHEPFCAEAARVLDLPVVAVDYRRAPEAPWPAAPDDCEAAARWVASSPAALGRSVTGLALAGDSAGGNLTIVTAMALRDRPAAVPVLAQLPIYPATDASAVYPSASEFADNYLLTSASMKWFDDAYAAEPEHVRTSPLLGDQHGMPPTLVYTASLDPIRDEGRAYAAKLIAAGVPTIFREAVGNIHGFIQLRKGIPSSASDIANMLRLLRDLVNEAEADRVMAQAAGKQAA